MPKQHYDLFLKKLALDNLAATLQQKRAALQQQIKEQHLEQEYARFISFAWLPQEQQELVQQAVQLRQQILDTAYGEARQQLVDKFSVVQQELHKQGLENDFLSAWELTVLLRK